MDSNYISLISGLFGALIGALASITTMVVQSRIQDKRERLRMAAQLAMEDYKLSMEFGKSSGRGFEMPPVGSYLYYHVRLMEMMEEGDVTPEKFNALTEDTSKLSDALREARKNKKP